MITCDFNREDNDECSTVWATVDLDETGVTFMVASDEATSPREWEIEEIEILCDGKALSFTPKRRDDTKIPYESTLGREIEKAWNAYVDMEQNLPYAAGAR